MRETPRCPRCDDTAHVARLDHPTGGWICMAPTHGPQVFAGTGQEYLDMAGQRAEHAARVARGPQGRMEAQTTTRWRGAR